MADTDNCTVAELRAELAAWLEFERDAGGVGLPTVSLGARDESRAALGLPGEGMAELPVASSGQFGAATPDQVHRAIPPSPVSRLSGALAVPPSGAGTVDKPGGPAGGADVDVGTQGAVGLGEAERQTRLVQLKTEVEECRRCELGHARNRSVFARGNSNARLMFIGEGPGRDEDRVGEPFVGAAGQLLDKMIVAMGLQRDEVYICNVVKCRPPGNRTPHAEEAGACERYLHAQIELVGPEFIVALGRCAVENLGCMPEDGGRWRGIWRSFHAVPLMPTYHPAFLLRSPEFKRPVWNDLQKVMARLRGE